MEVMVKEELCEIVKIRVVSDRVMTVVLVFEEDGLRLTCVCGLQRRFGECPVDRMQR